MSRTADSTLPAAAAAPPTPVRTSPRSAARWAGLGYLALFVLAIFANFLAVGAVLEPDDAGATFTNLVESESTFRLGVVAFLVVFVLDVAIAWALYVLFRDVHADVALLAAWFRLVYTVFLGVALVFAGAALLLADGSGPLAGGDGRDGQVLLALQAFELTWVIGLACFGVHLVLLGRLLVSADRAPTLLGWLLMVAGTAYVADTVAHLLLSDYADHADAFLAMVAVPSVVAELGLTVWLLLVGLGRRGLPVSAAAVRSRV